MKVGFGGDGACFFFAMFCWVFTLIGCGELSWLHVRRRPRCRWSLRMLSFCSVFYPQERESIFQMPCAFKTGSIPPVCQMMELVGFSMGNDSHWFAKYIATSAQGFAMKLPLATLISPTFDT